MLRKLLPALLLALFVLPAQATWSIVLVNRVTGEVLISSATCLGNFDLQRALPVVRVGLGGAAAQSAIDTGAKNRAKIFDQLGLGTPPAEILPILKAGDLLLHEFRQYGIVDRNNPPLGFTGNKAGAAKLDLAGSFGDWNYVVSGNVLTDEQVITAAASVLQSTPGDGMTKVAAAMEAARALGGDGRCSCSTAAPTSCGAPPAGGFAKSAHTGFFVVARPGDTDGICNGAQGCANGDYFLSLNEIGNAQVPIDPVVVLLDQLATFRASKAGVPDHFLSRVEPAADRLVADGITATTVTVELLDLFGAAIATGGASVTVSPAAGLAQVSAVADLGDGRYSFEVTAGTTAGLESLSVTVDDGTGAVLLSPPLELPIDPLAPLHAGFLEVQVGGAIDVPLTVNTTPGVTYLILASASGTAPGQPFPGGVLPLVADPVFDSSVALANSELLVNTFGVTDASGRAQGRLVADSGALIQLSGLTLDWAVLELFPALGAPTPGATLEFVP